MRAGVVVVGFAIHCAVLFAGGARAQESDDAEEASVDELPERPSPVLLVPGFAGWREIGALGSYFGPLKDALEDAGAEVYEFAPPPVASSEARGRALAKAIDRVRLQSGAPRVTILAHSQGGLDARVALDEGDTADKVEAVVTFSTPHHGTELADNALKELPRPLVRLALDTMSRTWQSEQHLVVDDPDTDGSLWALSRRAAKHFNAKHPDTHGVPFYSVAAVNGPDVDGSCEGGVWSSPRGTDPLHPLMGITRTMLRWGKKKPISDDGVVPTSSMKFGNFLGCVEADHVDWMGWRAGKKGTNTTKFIVELWRGLRDAEMSGDEDAMNAHLVKLATIAHADLIEQDDMDEGFEDDDAEELATESATDDEAPSAPVGEAPPEPVRVDTGSEAGHGEPPMVGGVSGVVPTP